MKNTKFFVSTLIAAAAMSATAYADHTFSTEETVAVSADTTHDSVTVDSGVTGTFNITTNNTDIKIDNLTLNGNLVINEPTCALAEIGNISGAGTLTLSKTSANSWGGALVLTGTASEYTGTINVWNGGSESNNPNYYSQFLILKNGAAAGKATINLGAATVLTVSADSVNIGGLNSYDSAAIVVSQASSFGYGVDPNPYNESYTGNNPSNDTTHRTLNIAGEGKYEYKGVFGSSTNIDSLSLGWSGTGMQTLSGNTYANNLTVFAGSLSLAGSSTISGSVSVTNAGSLSLGGWISLSSAIQNSGTISVSDSAVFALANLTGIETNGKTVYTLIEGSGKASSATALDADNVDFSGTTFVWRGATAEFSFSETGSTVAITGGTAGDLVWAGASDSGTWNYASDNTNWTIGGTATSFMRGDNVTFTSTAGNKTVSLENGQTLSVGTVTVESGNYTMSIGSGTAEVSGTKLSIDSDASLTVGTSNWHKVNLSFSDIEVFGALTYNNKNTTWSSLTMKEGSSLFVVDTENSGDGLRVEKMTLEGDTTVVATWDKRFTVGTLVGSGDLNLSGTATWTGAASFIVTFGDISEYTGIATFVKRQGLTINLTGDTSANSAARLVFGDGVTVNNTGTLTLDGEIALTDMGVINNTGTIYFNDSVKFDIGNMMATDNVYTLISGGTIDSATWNALAQSNFIQNGYELGRGEFSKSEVGKISFKASAGSLVWNGGSSAVWDLSSENWTNNGNADRFYNGDSVKFAGTGASSVSVQDAGVYVADIMVESGAVAISGGEIKTSSGSITVSTGASLTLNCNISELSMVSGSGLLDLSGQATILGSLTVSEGTVNISGNTTLSGTYSGTGTLNVKDGGVLTLVGDGSANNQTARTINVGAGATLKFGGHDLMGWSGDVNVAAVLQGSSEKIALLYLNDTNTDLVNKQGGMTLSRSIELKGNTLVSSENKSTFNTYGGKILVSGTNNTISDLTIQVRSEFEVEVSNDGDSLQITSAIISHANNEGTGGFTKTGAGTLILSGNNSNFARGADNTIRTMTISGGKLIAASATALGSGNVTVESGATLKLNVAVGGVGSVELNEGSTFAIDIAGFYPVATTADGDSIGLSILSASVLTFNGAAAGDLTSDEIDNYFDVSGSNLGEWAEWNRKWGYTDNTLTLTLSIPEPSAFGLLAGLGALALMVSRRRRAKKA